MRGSRWTSPLGRSALSLGLPSFDEAPGCFCQDSHHAVVGCHLSPRWAVYYGACDQSIADLFVDVARALIDHWAQPAGGIWGVVASGMQTARLILSREIHGGLMLLTL